VRDQIADGDAVSRAHRAAFRISPKLVRVHRHVLDELRFIGLLLNSIDISQVIELHGEEFQDHRPAHRS